jgi:hypothetical protein
VADAVGPAARNLLPVRGEGQGGDGFVVPHPHRPEAGHCPGGEGFFDLLVAAGKLKTQSIGARMRQLRMIAYGCSPTESRSIRLGRREPPLDNTLPGWAGLGSSSIVHWHDLADDITREYGRGDIPVPP